MKPIKKYRASLSMIESIGSLLACPVAADQPHAVRISRPGINAQGIFPTKKEARQAAEGAKSQGWAVAGFELCPPNTGQTRHACTACGCPHIYKPI